MSTGTGQLVVTAQFKEGGLHNLGVCLTRPALTRLLIGQTPEAVTKVVPNLFALCTSISFKSFTSTTNWFTTLIKGLINSK